MLSILSVEDEMSYSFCPYFGYRTDIGFLKDILLVMQPYFVMMVSIDMLFFPMLLMRSSPDDHFVVRNFWRDSSCIAATD